MNWSKFNRKSIKKEEEDSILEKSVHEVSELHVILMKSNLNLKNSKEKHQIMNSESEKEACGEKAEQSINLEEKSDVSDQSVIRDCDKDCDFPFSKSFEEKLHPEWSFGIFDKMKSLSESSIFQKNFSFSKHASETDFNITKLEKSKSLSEQYFHLKVEEMIRNSTDESFMNVTNDLWFSPLSRTSFSPENKSNLSSEDTKLQLMEKNEKQCNELPSDGECSFSCTNSTFLSPKEVIDLVSSQSDNSSSNEKYSIDLNTTTSSDTNSESSERKSSVDLTGDDDISFEDVKPQIINRIVEGLHLHFYIFYYFKEHWFKIFQL